MELENLRLGPVDRHAVEHPLEIQLWHAPRSRSEDQTRALHHVIHPMVVVHNGSFRNAYYGLAPTDRVRGALALF
eukprot:CAMPEP_0182525602 /NCGR_PEP_ID=MMETSP1323-20130603/2597_1 /TAXON_ID=236787 /ORGANISM="Florenciella parvula, Strain RCC1693" /LENGTH=74 /DNA_ID=CAMNT_0024734335 /DNA_START=271 /DNA_END=495 /DNA_ORIENTATION=+